MNAPALLNYRDAAQQLRVSPRTVRRYVAQQKIRVTRLSRRTVGIRQASLDSFMERATR